MSDPIIDNGVVGSGGAGFPTAVKLGAQAQTFVVNGAECEPLLHKDKELLLHYADDMLRGLAYSMERVGAERGIVGIKGKYEQVIRAIEPQLGAKMEVFALDDIYPAGDEFVLVYETTGRVIPPGGLPKDVGAVVNNVETLINIGAGKPVTHKYLTVGGAVQQPVTLKVPIGMSFGEVIEAAGGASVEQWDLIVGGVMMGRLGTDLDEPVTKTTGGLLVFPQGHPLVERYHKSWEQVERAGKSACDQCSFCTERCPRYLLGHPNQPHQAMRSLGFAPETERMLVGTLYCSECKLCSLFSCPEGLDPRAVCAHHKPLAREQGLKWSGDPASVTPHPLYKERRVPTKRLMTRLGLDGFHNTGPLDERELRPARVTIPLRQHVGAPSVPVVKVGEKVKQGQLVAAIPEKALGANIHASIQGTVQEVNASTIVIAG